MDKFEQCLKELLKEHLLEVVFTKTNGNSRVMNCTLRPDYIKEPVKEPWPGFNDSNSEFTQMKPRKQKSDRVLSVWDIDNSGWRSFRLDSVETYKVIRMRNED